MCQGLMLSRLVLQAAVSAREVGRQERGGRVHPGRQEGNAHLPILLFYPIPPFTPAETPTDGKGRCSRMTELSPIG